MEEKVDKKYYAFISYSHKDEEWAKWLQHEFEHYHLPTILNGLPNVPDNFRPIFRDVDELSGGELKPQIFKALRESIYLVVVCSPNSARSKYVDEEIREFVNIHKNNIGNIFPFIVEGIPNCADNPLAECFPKALKQLPSDIIAGDATKHGREHAFVKVLSGTLKNTDIRFSMLWNQFERDRIAEERKERERQNRLLLLESRYLSEKALDIAHIDSRLAKKLVLRALPENLNDPQDRPYCPEAESALRKIRNYRSSIFKHHAGVRDFIPSPKGDKAVSVSRDGVIKLSDIEKGLIIHEIDTHADGFVGISYSNDGNHIATFGDSHSIKLWNAETLTLNLCIETEKNEYVNRLVFTPDDKSLITLSNKRYLKFWNVSDGSLFHKVEINDSTAIAIDRKGQWLALATCNYSICIFDLNKLKIIKRIENAHSEPITSITFSPDGTRILSGAFDGKFKVWDWAEGTAEIEQATGKTAGGYTPIVHTVKYSEDGKWIVTATNDFAIRVWNAATGDLLEEKSAGKTGLIWSANFSPDGSSILSAHEDGTARIWDIKPKASYRIISKSRNKKPFQPMTTIGRHSLQIESCDILIVDSTDGSSIQTLKGHEQCVLTATFNPEGTKVASTSFDGTIRIWDLADSSSIVLKGHTSTPESVSFSPDSKLLVSASGKEVKVWSIKHCAQTGQDITIDSFDFIWMAKFTDDGEGIHIKTQCYYDILCDWKPLDKLIAQTREELEGREFTEEEKKKYYLE